ncbi:DNA internalization-related competence protein ComEC/Rec2 [Candidatus Magnetominusculus xianensis]|uniref:Competence protein ComEC n=1 Tax=Candidatus Magnetominusculus xianensis TaxID=1748249 RepID=A0ABR5SDJ0_9BACT|nr:DNA internalization-related competence protein ComEC/Rec2 [Candidatus Magnetominusculus xianensis]KWT83379.1 competence protein ComEC [Candidatus Magnetominusculus xianensis]MBF0405599.1 DNA internalization-related competence protein ComEC/Rec2 [Nitrospirota bacterium]
MWLYLSFISGVVLFHGKLYFPVCSVIVTICILGLSLLKRGLPLKLFIILSAGFFYAWFRYDPAELNSKPPPGELVITGTFTSLPVKVDYHSFKPAAAPFFQQEFKVRIPSGLFKKPVSIFYSRSRGFMPGTEATILTQMKLYSPPHIPGSYSYDMRLNGTAKRFLMVKESQSILWFFERQRLRLARRLESAFTGDTSTVLKSITIGDGSGISEPVRENFRATGLTHLLSISGTHFGMLTVLIFWISNLILSRMPYNFLLGMTIHISTKQLSAVLTLPIVTAYLLISGMSVPALRSFIMSWLFLVGLVLCRKGQWKNTLALAACIIELIDPESIFTASWQLSFFSCLFIGLASDRFNFYFTENEKPSGMKIPSFYFIDRFFTYIKKSDSKMYTYTTQAFRYIRDTVIVSLAATLGTMPIILYAFHSGSTVSLPANMIVVPYMCLLITPIILFSSFIYLVSGFFPLTGIIGLLTRNILDVIEWFARIPHSSINVKAFPFVFVIAAYVILLCFFLKKIKLFTVTSAAAAVLVIFYYLTAYPNTVVVTFIDVGQGDSALIETPNGKAIAIDTGSNGRQLEGYMRYRGKSTLHAMILSHGDSDHIGGLPNILRKFDVKYLIDNGMIVHEDMKLLRGRHISLKRGDVFTIDNVTLAILHPPEDLEGLGLLSRRTNNNTSLVIKLTGAHTSFLFTGDLETEGVDVIIGLKEKLRSDVLKVSHHGSRWGTSEEFISYLHPSIAVISAGRNNHFGHPTQEVLNNLRDIPTYRTDRQGAILVRETQRGFKVKTQFDYELIKTTIFAEEIKNIKRIFSVW